MDFPDRPVSEKLRESESDRGLPGGARATGHGPPGSDRLTSHRSRAPEMWRVQVAPHTVAGPSYPIRRQQHLTSLVRFPNRPNDAGISHHEPQQQYMI
ncbi:hypothetical protein VTN96DRAFT_1506 [Rasamsonia emersonii]